MSAPSVNSQIMPSWVRVFLSWRTADLRGHYIYNSTQPQNVPLVLSPSSVHAGKSVTSTPAAFIHHCDRQVWTWRPVCHSVKCQSWLWGTRYFCLRNVTFFFLILKKLLHCVLCIIAGLERKVSPGQEIDIK